MDLKLTRNKFAADGIFGNLKDPEGNVLAVTLEHAFPQVDGTFLPKAASGVYTCKLGSHRLYHMDHDFQAFELQNVPPFEGKPVSGILLHVGNYNKDSDGCILVGRGIYPNQSGPGEMITSSENTFNKLMDLQRDNNTFTLTIVS